MQQDLRDAVIARVKLRPFSDVEDHSGWSSIFVRCGFKGLKNVDVETAGFADLMGCSQVVRRPGIAWPAPPEALPAGVEGVIASD